MINQLDHVVICAPSDVLDADVLEVAKDVRECANEKGLWDRATTLTIDVGEDEIGKYLNGTLRYRATPFDRIRRITGYLVGTIDRWNDAKAAEEHDRVKHGM